MEDSMAHMADGPLGPQLRDRGFERLGDLSESAQFADMVYFYNRPVSRLQTPDWIAMSNLRRSIAMKRRSVPGLPIFLRWKGQREITLLIDVDGQVWFINEFVDITEIGCTELTKIE